MKKLFTLLIFFTCLQSCIVYVNEPDYRRPPHGHQGSQEWWYDDSDVPNDDSCTCGDETCNTPCPVHHTLKSVNDNGEETTPDIEEEEEIVPTHKWDSCTVNGVLTFNVYLGWSIGKLEEAIMLKDYPVDGGEIVFNIYTNNHCMSMYGFEKWRTDFYVFSSKDPYCGYSSSPQVKAHE